MKQELIKVVGLGNVSFDTSHTTYPSNAILLRKISINGKYYIFFFLDETENIILDYQIVEKWS